MSSPIVVSAESGVAWVERGGDHLFIEPHEIHAVCVALLALADAFEDAA